MLPTGHRPLQISSIFLEIGHPLTAQSPHEDQLARVGILLETSTQEYNNSHYAHHRQHHTQDDRVPVGDGPVVGIIKTLLDEWARQGGRLGGQAKAALLDALGYVGDGFVGEDWAVHAGARDLGRALDDPLAQLELTGCCGCYATGLYLPEHRGLDTWVT